jgi:tetratricopeptide (TPR) repeat protein
MKKTTKKAEKASVVKKPTAKRPAGKLAKAPPHRAVESKPAKPGVPGPPSQAVLQADAIAEFEAAMVFFRAGSFKEAKCAFDQLSEATNPQIAHAARLYARMCEQRLANPVPHLSTSEEFYNYGVALINERSLDAAQKQLETALRMTPHADHISYAMALCLGLKGDLAGAYNHLRRAIELQPRNRSLARNDPDFAEIGRRPPLNELVGRHS